VKNEFKEEAEKATRILAEEYEYVYSLPTATRTEQLIRITESAIACRKFIARVIRECPKFSRMFSDISVSLDLLIE